MKTVAKTIPGVAKITFKLVVRQPMPKVALEPEQEDKYKPRNHGRDGKRKVDEGS